MFFCLHRLDVWLACVFYSHQQDTNFHPFSEKLANPNSVVCRARHRTHLVYQFPLTENVDGKMVTHEPKERSQHSHNHNKMKLQ
uniref:Uncharacterized protein n=1 Tax=Arion vulgaris TaxID=1028688 RepID=A0A0B7ADC5_9EUPU